MPITIVCIDNEPPACKHTMKDSHAADVEMLLANYGLPVDPNEVLWHCGCSTSDRKPYCEFPNGPPPLPPPDNAPPPFPPLPVIRLLSEEEY